MEKPAATVRVRARLERFNDPEVLAEFGELDYDAPALGVHRFSGVTVLRSGIAIRRGRLIDASVHDYPHLRWGYWRRGIVSPFLRRPLRLPADRLYTYAHANWSRGYFHWITEAVPRLLAVHAAAPEATLLLPQFRGIGEVVEASAAAAGFERIERHPEDRNFCIPRLVLADVPRRKGEFHPDHLLAVGDAMRAHYGITGRATERIYVTRREAAARKVVNEAEVSALLERRGFRVVAAERLPFAEQVRLFGSARTVVAIHGAGLTNILWMPPGGAVLEFTKQRFAERDYAPVRRTSFLNPSYARMAAICGHAYAAQICPPADPAQTARVADLIVDVAQLERSLDRLESA